MAHNVSGVGKLQFFTLHGPLDLFHKGLFRGQYRRYWFWFDERTCSLKYYKNEQTYSKNVREPIGVIDLRYAKVTPGLAKSGGNKNNVFNISLQNESYLLAAEDNQTAIKWIEKLQEKRGEFIKASSLQHEATEETEKKRTLSLLTKPAGALAAEESAQVAEDESPSVRKIFMDKFQGDRSGRLAMHLDSLQLPSSRPDVSRRSTVGYSPVSHISPDPISLEDSALLDESAGEDQQDSSEQTTLQPHERAKLALEACLLESQNKAFYLQKEVNQLKEQLRDRERDMEELNKEVAALKDELAMRKAPRSGLQMENENLKNIIEQYKRSVKSLDDEIELHKLNQSAHDKMIQKEKQRSAELERELNFIKSKYVRILSEQFKITVPSSGGRRDGENEDLANENKYRGDLLALLQKEGGENSVFATYCSTFEDNYGDRYDWEDDSVTQHYLCRLLYTHYNYHEYERLVREWEEYIAQVKRIKGTKDLLQLNGEKKKLKPLLRKGIPPELRAHVWSSLVHQSVGRSKEVRDKAADGKNYYKSLLKNSHTSSSTKQIKLDLYRTLPSNKHFKSGGAGADKLERVLLAYSLHNTKVGYCQGMNMIAAFALLYLDEETSFWFLVMIIEKLMPTGYYTPGLLGAQADLAVVKKLVAEKLPQINAHLQEYFIDVTLVTFNWFLTLFVDALPTEAALRILDCFLSEGHKILFRVSLAILKVNEKHILSMSDPVGLFQFLKEVARHSFDVEELFNGAFVELNPFPRRHQLNSWHQSAFQTAKEQWNQREKQRLESEKKQEQQQTLNLLTSIATKPAEQAPAARHLQWECGCVRGRGEAWLCCDEKGQGRLGVLTVDGQAKPLLEVTSCKVNSRIITAYHEPSSDLLLVGTLDFVLQVINCNTREVIASHKFKDSILDIVGTSSHQIVVGMADGNIAMLSSCLDDDPCTLHIGFGSVASLVVSGENTVWCGAGKTIMVVSTETFEPVHSLLVSSRVNKMKAGPHGVWVSFRSSTTISLYDSFVYLKLLEVDYTTLCTTLPGAVDAEVNLISHLRVTSLMADGEMVFIGTGGGDVYQFHVLAGVADPEASIRSIVAERGKRASRKRRNDGDGGTSVTGGLLSKPSLTDQEKGPTSEATVNTQPSYYASRTRKNRFGLTLRHGRPEVEPAGHSVVAVYKLEFKGHKQLGSAVNEPVRVLLPIGSGALACVNRVVEWDKCVAVLNSNESTTNKQEELIVEYVPTPRLPSPQQARALHSDSPDQALVPTSF